MYTQYYVDNSAFRVYNKTIENVKMRRSNVMSWFVFALLSAVFAAATSILAKVARDRYMEQMAEQYPEYRFEKHKGYGTKLHYQMIDQYGPCGIHRMSFLKKLLNNG